MHSLTFKIERKLFRFYSLFGLGFYVLIPKIIKEIKKWKPHIIITQTGLATPAIVAAKIMKVSIINIIRDTSLICPKNVDIIEYGIACKGLRNKNICYDCINNWRTLRERLGNKPQGWRFSLNATITTLGYKMKYLICCFNLFLFNLASVNIVASELMKSILSINLSPQKIKVLNITPVKKKMLFDNIKKSNQILFLIPSYDASHKGLDFVLKLTQKIPSDYKIVIVGQKLPVKKINHYHKKVLNFDKTVGEDLDKLFQKSKLTLIPTFCTEAFGRVIIESLLNKTPVISSPNCGANEFFKNSDYVKIVPLKQSLWVKEINNIIENPPIISESEIEQILNKFSLEKSIDDFLKLIRKLNY